MILSLLVLVVVGLVAYFHYIQGFFSATLSAILAGIAAIVAIGFHETIIVSLLGGKMAEMAHSVVLVGLFALVYIILRVLFDSVVPGNVNVPLTVDKIGAGVMGVVAGLFAGGIFAIAAQALPFGPSVGGFTRYELAEDQELTVGVPGPPPQSIDGKLSDMLKNQDLGAPHGLLVPADKFVLGVASKVSTGGSLAGTVPWGKVHPDLLQQLFLQKLGIQVGGKRVAVNTADAPQVSLVQLFTVSPLPVMDSEHPTIKYTRWAASLEPTLKTDGANVILIARISLAGDAADTDGNVRLSPASVRLMAGGRNYLPLGTLDHASGPFLRRTRLDDFLFVPNGGVIDLVFHVAAEDLGVTVAATASAPWKIADGTFIEAKRLGMVDVSGMEIKRADAGHPTQAAMLQKSGMDKVIPKNMTPRALAPVAGGAAGPEAAAPGAPLENVQAKVSAEFIAPINVGRFDGDVESHSFGSGSTATIRDKKFVKLQLNVGPPVASVGGVEFPIGEMWVPPEHKLVQISGIPLAMEGSDSWEWATRLGQFSLIDGNNDERKPNGAWAKVKHGTNDRMVAMYNATEPVGELPRTDARPTDVWIVFVVPIGTALQELKFGTVRVASVNLTVQ